MKNSISKFILSSALLMTATSPVAVHKVNAETVQSQATVIVNNEEGEAVANTTVTLFDGTKEVTSIVTDAKGQAILSNVEGNKNYSIQVEGMPISNAYAKVGAEIRVYVDSNKLKEAKTKSKDKANTGVTFNAYVINHKYQYVKGQKIKLVDITEGKKVYGTKTTNKYGKVVFSKLPNERNFAVYINGKNQGYTIRGVEGSKLAKTFYVNKKGAFKYHVPTAPAKVVVVDEDANAIKGQKVDLYRGTIKVRSQKTKRDGSIAFTNKITVGTHYNIFVNGKKIPYKYAKSGDTTYVYLTSKQIKK